MRSYLQHGRRHAPAPGGSDPIPGFVGSSAWAILQGTQLEVAGLPTSTLPATTTGLCVWTSFVTSGDLDVFATHNNVAYPGYAGVVVPSAASFNNSNGDKWVFAVKTGIILAWFDIAFLGSSFPLHLNRSDGHSHYQGNEPFGIQTWDSNDVGGNAYSWSWSRPIDNDPGDYYDTPGDDFWYEFAIQAQNLDSVDHTIDPVGQFQLTLAWIPVTPLTTKFVY